MEMRTTFGRNMAVVLTKVNDFYYINLYNNNPRNPGRCALGWDEFCELVRMKDTLDQIFPEFEVQNSPQQLTQVPHQSAEVTQQAAQVAQQAAQVLQHKAPQEMMHPPPPYTAQPIRVLNQPNKRHNTLHKWTTSQKNQHRQEWREFRSNGIYPVDVTFSDIEHCYPNSTLMVEI